MTKDIAPTYVGLVLFIVSLLGFCPANAQCDSTAGDYALSIELLHQDIGSISGAGGTTDLTGFNTYRVFLNCEGTEDKLSAIEGNSTRPLNISSTTSFHQTSLFSGSANALPNFISPFLFTNFPDAEYDSWVTIGISETPDAAASETEVKLLEDSDNPLSGAFASGNDIEINSFLGTSWYIQDSDNYTNGLAGADGKVLVAQLTTDGEISGQLGMQVFRDGISNLDNCARPYLSFQSHGCMESNACNYAPTAIFDDGSCDFCNCSDSLQVLTASFPSDSIPNFSLEVEIIADHDTTGVTANILMTPNPLEGMKTYRVYAQVDDPTTIVNAGFGGQTAPLAISSTEPFYQSPLGGTTPSNISISLFDIFPYQDLRYDSWVTIGIDRLPSQMASSPSGATYEAVTTAGNWPAAFNGGGGLYASGAVGGTWFSFPNKANVEPDENLRVLIAQFTTAGIVSGSLGLQIVPEVAPSDSTNDYRLPFTFTTEGLGDYTPILPEICTCTNADNDYICDDVDPCIGAEDICGVCNGPGEIYECGCNDTPPGDCDCNGNQLDAIGNCGGDCAADLDGNGVCDDSEILGCMDDNASNFDAVATQDDGSCFYNGCTDPEASNYDAGADTDDGSCIYPGCTDSEAWNYDPEANQNDGSCQANACGVDGVLVVATNYAFTPSDVSIPVGGTVVWQNNTTSLHNVNGDIDSQTNLSFGNPETFSLPNSVGNAQGTCMGSLTFNVPGVYNYDCSIGIHAPLGMVASITVGTGGCTNTTANNYDNSADFDNGSCTFAGCTNPSACNYNSSATSDDGSCTFSDGICETCSGATDGTGTIVDNDADNDDVCDNDEIAGCQDNTACNFNAAATDSDGSCTYTDGICQTCVDGNIVDNDADGDDVCDNDEIAGCQDNTACNYNAAATDSDGSCTYIDGICETCSGATDGTGTVVDNDADNDDVCDNDEIAGCQDNTACNYNAAATDSDGSCTYTDGICQTCVDGTIVDNDTDNDEVCDNDEVAGCEDNTACNYNAAATDSDGSCTYTDGICQTCSGATDGTGTVIDNDADGDDVCDNDEIAGCQDNTACNYNAAATDSDGSCTYTDGICQTCSGATDGTGTIVDNDVDGDDVCDNDEVAGCQDNTACNYNAAATDSDGSCTYTDGICQTCSGATDGTGTIVDNDVDGDDVCDNDEISGCQDNTACNYNAAATDSDGSCTYTDGICQTCSGATDGTGTIVDNDADNDDVCDNDEIAGCQDNTACNYNAAATDSDESCTYTDGICQTCSGATDGTGTIVDNDADGDDVCNNDEIAGCQDNTACNYNAAATDSDGSCTYTDGICQTCSGATDGTGTIVDNDVDGDDVCDNDEISGCQDNTACNYNAAATDSDGSCTYTDGICQTCSGAIDGTGTIVDNDADGDDVCDNDEIAGCQDNTACNYNAAATDSDGSCTYTDGICQTCSGATDGTGTIIDNDVDGDDVCDNDEISGCQDNTACNYNAAATDSDGSCTYTDGICQTCSGAIDGTGTIVDNDVDGDDVCDNDEVAGCQDNTACNYNAAATDSDGSCTYTDGICQTCSGATDGTGTIVDNDVDGDDVCDNDEVAGCQDNTACNYNAAATDSDGSCTYTDGICQTCSGATDGTGTIVDNDADNDDVCDNDEISGCQDNTACNYNTAATDSDGSCTYTDGICQTCSGATDGTGTIVDNDADNDDVCDNDEIAGCQDNTACNYNAAATDSDGSCTYTDGICQTCVDGNIVDNDADGDDVCDLDELRGCTNPAACNYDATTTTDSDNSLCVFPVGCDTCSGATDGTGTVIDNDADNDDVCDNDEIAGCQDNTACNYNAAATDSDGSCTYTDGICQTCVDGNIVDNDADGDDVCDLDELRGCTNPAACNYDATTTTDSDNSLCVFPVGCDTCSGATDGTGTIVDNDADNDDVCDNDEIAGCQDNTACNYNAAATDSDGSCTYTDGICQTCVAGNIVDNDADGDDVCDNDEVAGCTDPAACNVGAFTDTDNSLCTYTDGICQTCVDGNIVDNDADGDDVCDNDEVAGCTDPVACNVGAFTDTDNSLCTYTDGICQTCVDGNIVDNDADGDDVCDNDEISGCQDNTACNYNAAATDSDGSCTYTDGICQTCVDGNIVDNDADGDDVCDLDELRGCTNPAACNYDATTTTDSDNSLCVFPVGCDTCSGATDGTGTVIDNDADNDDVCDNDEIAGCQDNTACNYNAAATDSDGSCTYTDGICQTCVDGNIVDNDADGDDVCDLDELRGCTNPAACNYDATTTTDSDNSLCVFPVGCDTCSGATDGTGTIVDNDADNDDVCDNDEISGCQDNTACNYNAAATDSDGSCTYTDGICQTCVDGNIVDNDADGDDVCDNDEVAGCTDPAACNVGAFTDTDNSLCTYTDGICQTCVDGNIVDNDADGDDVCDNDEVAGCTDPVACNVGAFTDTDNSLCTYTDGICQTCVDGNIVDNDADGDDVCDNDEISGCQDNTACNYNAAATDSDGSCTFTDGICQTCSGATDGTGTIIDNDADGDDVCDNDEISGCQDNTACNYNAAATDSDGSCTYTDGICQTCSGATDGTGTIIDNDADGDDVCDNDEVAGCQDNTACNYNAAATDSDGSCTYTDGICQTCSGATDGTGTIIDNDADGDDVCDNDEVAGCQDNTACNYNAAATDSDGSCTFTDGICQTCSGATDGTGTIVDNDADGDDVCDNDEISGCQDNTACNYNAAATDSDGSCTFTDGICQTCSGATDGTGTIIDNDADGDDVCDNDEVAGCQDNTACNYNAAATDSDGSCTFTDGICQTCSGATDGTGTIIDNDADGDDVCDNEEISGCQDNTACNYNAAATDSDGSCTYTDGICQTCSGATDGTGTIVDNDADNDDVCDNDEVAGCTNLAACNYNPLATDNDDSCEFTSCAGCTDALACNYDENATQDDASCVYAETGLDCNGDCLNDSNNNGICDEDEIDCPDFNSNGTCDDQESFGCTYPDACNFQLEATADDGSCVYAMCGFNCDGSSIDGTNEYAGCTYSQALNFSDAANVDDGSCTFPDTGETGACLFDVSNDGIVNTPDLLIFLSLWETTCE